MIIYHLTSDDRCLTSASHPRLGTSNLFARQLNFRLESSRVVKTAN